jgi:ribosomal protein L29
MTLKAKDIQKMKKEERIKKLKELKLELIKSRNASQKTKTKEIKKIIARILTLNK